MMKNAVLFLRFLHFCADNVVTQKNSLLRKPKLILKFMTSQARQKVITIHIFPNNSKLKGNTTLLLLYINELLDNVICNITIYADDSTLYSKCYQASDLWQQLQLTSELECELQDTVDQEVAWREESNLLISMLEKLNQLYLTNLITLLQLMRKWMGLLLGKGHLLRDQG